MYLLTMLRKMNIISTEKMFMLLYIEYKQQLFDIANNETEDEQQQLVRQIAVHAASSIGGDPRIS